MPLYTGVKQLNYINMLTERFLMRS